MALSLHLGRRIAPPRFIAFVLILIAGLPILQPLLGWRQGTMAAFDIAAVIFLVSIWPLLKTPHAREMRVHAERNDANRAVLLGITGAVMLVVLVAVGSELIEKGSPKGLQVALIIATLLLSWLFTNIVYALHYAHMFYSQEAGDEGCEDIGGLDFPSTKEPNYWDFVYFSLTLGMTFQTSDVEMTTTSVRIVATFHCFAAFIFNLGVLAFTINTLGGG
ncbi:DUF1345 domain-containing protein [Sphingomonas sp. CGMCC 1.13654]|uniref:DUF1345 domain-containing protein n=1 Tax=Sphingomonas chungangi TaxID=2683589 RepID=A0A838L8B5_9SPHN|nr:DUF1345 domain-containing protein [Sphingomonas chungangi]MBA2935267.1 DUF1345 domain-containing protein [Sphingomonas chungangi]MVW56774.1 DUF1345 domain-containing protein [Sphingomonas chungangi]